MKNNLAKSNPALLFLIALTFIGLGFGSWKIYHNIYSPFAQPKIIARLNSEEQLRLLTQDSDKDGLFDIKEESIGTSAYISDTDSDGFSDKEEFEAGSNPLDPGSTPQNKIASKEPVVLEKLLGAVAASAKETTSELSPAEIREILVKQAGLSKDLVDKVDDEALIKLYNETKAELGAGLPTGTSQLPVTSELPDFSKFSSQFLTGDFDKNFFNLLTGAQIRELLIEAGADKKTLESIDDETLKTLFLQAIESTK